MVPNPRFKFLKQFFGVEEKKDESREDKVIKEMQEDNETRQIEQIEVIEKGKSLDISKTLRSEFNFLKFPFFDLSPRASKKDRIEIREVEETEDERIEILWQVSRNIDTDFPSSFARKVHKEAVEKVLNSAKRPVPRLIKLGSLRQICKSMKITPSGNNCNEVKKALESIKSAKITTKGTFRKKEKNGGKRYHEGCFSLYDMVFFSGETLPDGTEADSVYILLNDMYIKNFNYNYVVPLDYSYLQSLEGDIASRMYEVFIIWFYPSLENRRGYIDKKYSEICDYFPLTRQNEKWRAKGQLKKAHTQHVLNGFLSSEPEWIELGERDDWLIRYWIGPEAKNWYQQNRKLVDAGKEFKQLEAPKQRHKGESEGKTEKPAEENPLIIQLSNLGITKKVAEDLVEHSHPKAIQEWIEAIHETKAKDKAAFIVKAIQENWELPESFKAKKKAQVKERQKQKEESLKAQYNKFIAQEIDKYIAQIGRDTIEKEIEGHREVFLSKYPFYRQFKESETLRTFIEADYCSELRKKIGLPSFEEWIKENQEKKELFEIESIEENQPFSIQDQQITS